jgi:hypothetical protein
MKLHIRYDYCVWVGQYVALDTRVAIALTSWRGRGKNVSQVWAAEMELDPTAENKGNYEIKYNLKLKRKKCILNCKIKASKWTMKMEPAVGSNLCSVGEMSDDIKSEK